MPLDYEPKGAHASNYEISQFEYLRLKCEVEYPPIFIRLYPNVTEEMRSMVDSEMEEVQNTLSNPTDDPRKDWAYIAYCLAMHELLSTGGLCVDRDAGNWEPLPYQNNILEDFVSANVNNWPHHSGERRCVRSDARHILFKEKHAIMLWDESAHAAAKTKTVGNDNRPAALCKIDAALKKVTSAIDTLKLDAIVRNLIKNHHLDHDVQSTNYLIEKIAAHQHIHLGKRDARTLVKNIIKEIKKANQPKKSSSEIPIVNEWADFEMANWAQNKLADATDANGDPVMYDYEGDVADMYKGQRRMLSEVEFAAELNTHTRWVTLKSEGETRGVFAPKGVVNHNYNRSDKPYSPLSEVKSAPFFALGGRRVDQPGYDSDTKTYLASELDVPQVNDVPSEDEVFEAKRLIIEEVLGDFPFEGVVDREERLKRGLHNAEDTKPLPSMAHTVCMIIERATRDMITGPTPVYTPSKPMPGTGAGRLIGAVTIAATGRKAAAEPMPTTEEEYAKVMGAHISQSEEYVYFDNMNAALTLGPFASNVSEGRVRTRLLGSSRMIEADVRHTWIAAANNIKGTSEILRRMVLIELDAKTPNPENRVGFRHNDLEGWVLEHRPQLVWAILTLIQNWVAKGMRPWEGRPKASFESWSRVMGGILRDAGIRGFLGNEDRLRSYGATGGDSGLEVFIQYLAEKHASGALFRAGGTADIRGRKGELVYSVKDVLNSADDGNPLLLDGWGYSRDDGQYNHARGITSHFRDAARRAYEVTLYENAIPVRYAVSFTEAPDPQSPKQLYWELVKTKIDG